MTDAEKLLATHMNRVRGQLAGMIESFGLPEKQEKGAISTLKTLTYAMQDDLKHEVLGQGSPARASSGRV